MAMFTYVSDDLLKHFKNVDITSQMTADEFYNKLIC